ncbi:MAG: hypothetical protein BAJATHORv1_30430 [Candidatus Thorarchaeota archaeon]|nr:MAG: hypothetical protein BAJATHORv1_30430 [Candidatus Thorarchaeota archaeon]
MFKIPIMNDKQHTLKFLFGVDLFRDLDEQLCVIMQCGCRSDY